MFSVDAFTKVVLSIIAACLVVLCFEQARWSNVETVQAQQPTDTMIKGYIFNDSGQDKRVAFGNGAGQMPGLPVMTAETPKGYGQGGYGSGGYGGPPKQN
jgi:hypothetical protein